MYYARCREAVRGGASLFGGGRRTGGIPKPLFLVRLGDYGVATFRQTEAETSRPLATLRLENFNRKLAEAVQAVVVGEKNLAL